VCGRQNPRGLDLQLVVDDQTGVVSVAYVPRASDVGFRTIVHGGVTATIADEVMVWAATWAAGQFCLAAELALRYKKPVVVGSPVTFEASVVSHRSRLVLTRFRCIDDQGVEFAIGTAKYVPMSASEHAQVVDSFLIEPETRDAALRLSRT
jgi:uncharacterized protein (TIGR00369 family)